MVAHFHVRLSVDFTKYFDGLGRMPNGGLRIVTVLTVTLQNLQPVPTDIRPSFENSRVV